MRIGIDMSIAIVTGASSGIGEEFCRALDSRGYDCIWLLARRIDRLQNVSEHLHTATRVISCDLTDRRDLERLRIDIETHAPDIGMLVCCAGVGYFGMVTEYDPEEQHTMIDLNIGALTDTVSFCVPFMHEGSSIIALCSLSAYIPMPHLAVYSSTKAFVRQYCNSIRDELRPRGIKVLEVSPGWVDTDFIDICKKNDVPDKVFSGMCTKEQVVEQAFKDLSKNRKRSCFGIRTKLRSFFGLHFNGFALRMWNGYWKR